MTAKPVFTLWLAAVIGAALFLPVYGNAQEGPGTFNSTDDLIQKLASQAVNNAERENHIDLNYSVESIKTIDKILWRAHEAYVKNPKSVSVTNLGSVYGAYVGEVIRRTQSNARWQRDDKPGGENSYPLVWGQTMHVYPMRWCQERILSGGKFSIWTAYSAAKELASHRVL